MAEQYDNTDTGALFGNTKKREGQKDPDLQGKLNIKGVEHWISAWFFTYDKDGAKRKGIRIKINDPVEAKPPEKPKPNAGAFDDMADDVPW